MSAIEESFVAAFSAIHGVEPYLWQRRLLREVITSGWPRQIAAPTGAGKTAVLDVALFHLALEARRVALGEGAATRAAPLRIVLAVDRRIIVDQAFERASRIAVALGRPPHPAVAEAAGALASLSGHTPLQVAQLRGGLPREDDWARSPVQPTILCTTVDQLGSRLFFRGYGVSPAMAPIHAGLLGSDTLLILDEAHLSAAFEETLFAVRRRRAEALRPIGLPFHLTSLSATPRQELLGESDLALQLTAEERAEEPIRRRLSAIKPMTLHALKGHPRQSAGEDAEKEDDAASGCVDRSELADVFADAAKDLARGLSGAPTVAIVVNRVAFARAIHRRLDPEAYPGTSDCAGTGPAHAQPRAMGPANDDARGEVHPVRAERAILLTGRVRPLERDALIAAHRDRLERNRAWQERDDGRGEPLFVVATQCIEAGADFDFDAMVTEIAPLDALTQRLGRLNRAGSCASAPCRILAPREDIASKTDDPVYGDRMRKTWAWLNSRQASAGALYCGPEALAALIAADPAGAEECRSVPRPAPVLRCADVEFFSMTNPAPHPDPHLPLFLHGDPKVETDVSVVWRADLTDPDLVVGGPGGTPRAAQIVAVMPPLPAEALALPAGAVRALLAAVPSEEVADAPFRAEDGSAGEAARTGRLVIRWHHGEPKIASAKDIRPGDTVVVPASFGGCDRFGWAPGSGGTVADLAHAASRLGSNPQRDGPARQRRGVRLHPEVWHDAFQGCGPPWADIGEILRRTAEERRQATFVIDEVRAVLAGYRAEAGEAHCLDADLEAIRRRQPWLAWPYEEVEGAPLGVVIVSGSASAATEDNDTSSFGGIAQSLEDHVAAVVKEVTETARRLGLAHTLAASLDLAARFHDEGKRDPRFQALLRLAGKGAAALPPDLPLAKSGGTERDLKAREGAGLPVRWRHEAFSVRLAAGRLGEADGVDPDLVLWLIGTHHGQGRPFFRHDDPWDDHDRPVEGATLAPGAGPNRLDFQHDGEDWAGLFARLKRRYGVWGLAFLEAALRLADHRASEAHARSAGG